MPRFKTEKFCFNGADKAELKFSSEIYIDEEGTFSTTIPKNVLELFEKAGVSTGRNRAGNYGYFTGSTFKALCENVAKAANDYLSRHCVNELIVIRYIIQTTCAYCKDVDGNIVPNGGIEWTKSGTYKWEGGTIAQHAASPLPYGITMYAQPVIRRDYVYKSGSKKTEYFRLNDRGFVSEVTGEEVPIGYWCKFLNSWCSMATPSGEGLKEMPYTEKNAQFFSNMLVSICTFNDKIKEFLQPDKLAALIEGGMSNLLGGTGVNQIGDGKGKV